MKVLITGGGGFIGSHLAEAHLALGDEVWAIDTATHAKVRHLLADPRFHYVRASVLDPEAIEAFVIRADLVYHHAAVVGVEHYVDDPRSVLDVNILGTLNVLRLAHRHGKRVVYASSSEVYGRNTELPWAEDADRVLGPTTTDRWCYSTSKAAAESYCWAYARLGLEVTVLRYFNVYGPRLDAIDAGRVLTIFIGQLFRGEPLTILGDGRQTRCFTYVDDAVRATLAAARSAEAVGGAFNVGDDRETTILELATTLLELHGRDPEGALRFVTQQEIYGASYEDIPRRVPDLGRMKTVLGVAPRVALRDGLQATLDWFRRDVRPRSTPGV